MHGNAPRSRSRIFTCRKMKITTSPFVYRGVAVFMPEKVGNLQFRESSILLIMELWNYAISHYSMQNCFRSQT